jgi:hypothetical protein
MEAHARRGVYHAKITVAGGALALVSVSGACSRAGKTALAETLLRALPRGRAAAVKFTTTEDVFERCPRGTACVVCDIAVPFRIVTDARVLDEPGTDTARLARAGASRVVWAIARRSAAAAAWDEVEAMVAGEGLAVMEGSTIVALARPDLSVFVAHPFLPPARWKATSPALIAGSDLVVVNRPAAEPRPPSPEVLEALRLHRSPGGIVTADVTRPLVQWAPALASRLERLS